MYWRPAFAFSFAICLIAGSIGSANVFGAPRDEDILHLIFPDQNVSSRPIVEFRYRNIDLRKKNDPSRKTIFHTFVVLGRELSDGSTIFFGAAGLYPQPGEGPLQEVRNVLDSPGHVDYTIADLHSDGIFRVHITAEQENAVRFLINSWNAAEYKLAEQNCTSLVRSVGNILGLDTGLQGATELTPGELIERMKINNDIDTPLRHALRDWEQAAKNIISARQKMGELIRQMNDHLEQVQKANASWSALQQLNAHWSTEYYRAVQGQKVVRPEINLFPISDPLSAYWPWPPPSPLKEQAKPKEPIPPSLQRP